MHDCAEMCRGRVMYYEIFKALEILRELHNQALPASLVRDDLVMQPCFYRENGRVAISAFFERISTSDGVFRVPPTTLPRQDSRARASAILVCEI